MSQKPPANAIEESILFIRGQKVMLDRDLAKLYGVQTKDLNKAVKRNPARFPSDFMFRLTGEEDESLRYQIGTSNSATTERPGRGGRRYLPYVFTEVVFDAIRELMAPVAKPKRSIGFVT